jgi:hypothetical protein
MASPPQFYVGIRSGQTSPGGVPHTHILYAGAMLSPCGKPAPQGWELGSPTPTTDTSQITCGDCLAAVTQTVGKQ